MLQRPSVAASKIAAAAMLLRGKVWRPRTRGPSPKPVALGRALALQER